MKILVTIASYGTANDPYLERVIKEYRSMPHDVDVVMLSNIAKETPAGVELVVGLPTGDPWSLPFAHKRVLAERVNRYELFIYSENDVLITAENIESFLQATAILPENEVAGFLRTELGPDGERYYPEVHKTYHWDPQSVVRRGNHVFACFTCEHSGCFVLTRRHLQRVMDSGNFLVGPHEGKYDLACTAATDPYTQCGLVKMICVTDLNRFLVPHLSNKYVGTNYDLPESDFDPQVRALLEISEGRRSSSQLLEEETPPTRLKWFKQYYEATRPEILKLIPAETKNLLSVGCGWGALEGSLIKEGVRVTGVPLDSVISVCAEARGVEVVTSDFAVAWTELSQRRFECILLSNILHLVPDPDAIVKECVKLLSPGGQIVVLTPNFNYLKVLWRRICRVPGYRALGNYEEGGVNVTTRNLVGKWLETSGLIMHRAIEVVPKRLESVWGLVGVAAPYLATEVLVTGHKKSAKLDGRTRDHVEIDSELETQMTAHS